MARLSGYPLDRVIEGSDRVIGTDGSSGTNGGATVNYTVDDLRDYILTGIETQEESQQQGQASDAALQQILAAINDIRDDIADIYVRLAGRVLVETMHTSISFASDNPATLSTSGLLTVTGEGAAALADSLINTGDDLRLFFTKTQVPLDSFISIGAYELIKNTITIGDDNFTVQLVNLDGSPITAEEETTSTEWEIFDGEVFY